MSVAYSTMSRNPLGRLGHNLSVREYLAGFVIAPSTRDVFPWLVGHVAVRIVQRNDILDRRQKLKFGALLRLGPAQLDGAHKRREWHLAPVLRRAQWRWRRRGKLGPVPAVVPAGVPQLRPDVLHGGCCAVAHRGRREASAAALPLGAVCGLLRALRREEVLRGSFEGCACEPGGLVGGWRGHVGAGGGEYRLKGLGSELGHWWCVRAVVARVCGWQGEKGEVLYIRVGDRQR